MTGRSRGAPGSGRSTRDGFAILLVLLALLVLTGVLHATLTVARFQSLAGRAAARALQARLAVQSGLRLAISDLSADDVALLATADSVLTRSVRLGRDAESTVLVRRLAPEWLWLEGEGRSGSGTGRGIRRLGAVYWILEPASRVEALRATVEVGGATVTRVPGSISPLLGGATDPGHARGICQTSTDPLAGGTSNLQVPTSRPATAGFAGSAGTVTTMGLESIPRLGLLDGTALIGRAGHPGSNALGGGTPPGGGGGSGTPTGSAGPGGGSGPTPVPALRVVDGSFTVPSDGYFGVLAVTGDLDVPAGREFSGLALVGGDLIVREGARLLGAARVRGSVAAEGAASISGSPCTVLSVLRGLPALSRPLSPPGGTWIDLS